MLPKVLGSITIYAWTDAVMVILAGASLGILGLGAQPPTAEWGVMIADGQPYVLQAWWICLFPGIAMVTHSLGFILVSDGGVPPPEGFGMSLVSVQGLSVAFPGDKGPAGAVRNVSFDLNPGEILGIVGESGSGKSTVARTIVRLIAPTGGRVMFEGKSVADLAGADLTADRRAVQMVFQSPFDSFNPRMTAQQTIAEPIWRHGLANRSAAMARALELMDMVELPRSLAGRRPRALSGRQCQRVGIARALALSPRLLIADAVTSALDVTVQAQILRLLTRLRKEHDLTVIYISHDLTVVRKFCDRAAVFQGGRLVETGATADLFASPSTGYTRYLIAAAPDMDQPMAERA